jgi:tRNA/tmRNA/rRNA uracil-C5-methylase (TrmA/RlmC/RlmD family)
MAIDSIREIELAENIDASNRVVQLDAVSAISPLQLEGLATEGLTGLVSQGETAGSPYATDRLALGDGIEVTLRRHVRAFFQGNRYLLSALVHHVIGCVPEKSTVVDLYAGAGLFSLSAAALRGATVVAVEGDRIAAADLHANASTSGGAVTPVHQTVEAFLETSVQADCLVVDPPRTGVSRQALDAIVGRRAARIVYISCDVATLARDARRLIDAGYTLERIDGFDLFPNTPHVETVAVFQNLKDVTI